MGLFHRDSQPTTSYDELAKRYALLAADVERLQASLRTWEATMTDTLVQVRKNMQRVERANERAEKNARPCPETPEIDVGEGLPTSGFVRKWRELGGA